jgi:hypothetical protein
LRHRSLIHQTICAIILSPSKERALFFLDQAVIWQYEREKNDEKIHHPAKKRHDQGQACPEEAFDPVEEPVGE